MSRVREDLEATADSITADARRLIDLEGRRGSGAATVRELREISAEVSTLVEHVQAKSRLQSRLADALEDDPRPN